MSTTTYSVMFQSTRPVGARHFYPVGVTWEHGVSIHAPRAGRDTPVKHRVGFQYAPRAGRDVRKNPPWSVRSCFNPRAPYGARPDRDLTTNQRLGVSIHAPRAGRDVEPATPITKTSCFNPRAPCGARRRTGNADYKNFLFQSTRPVRGATTGRNR